MLEALSVILYYFIPRINRLYHLERAKARKKKSQINENSFDVERKDLFFKQELKCMILEQLYYTIKQEKVKQKVSYF